eukprot:CAMPEP_0118877070 /NCGR_PEP_ID=MMETSP1163-20130328/17504_1 /TAXON_ID=124430 /ORGANISM="Phaeomonas parva, Strain CCMP2877" /LENGTH=161 /DNA_ID=CAMNT_0006812749 /DNA_START=180 /DNA_END=665 /DNA_ORIENTATION=+
MAEFFDEDFADLEGEDDEDLFSPGAGAVEGAAQSADSQGARDADQIAAGLRNVGFRDGLDKGKETRLQDGFDAGYRSGMAKGFDLGVARGGLSTLLEVLARDGGGGGGGEGDAALAADARALLERLDAALRESGALTPELSAEVAAGMARLGLAVDLGSGA